MPVSGRIFYILWHTLMFPQQIVRFSRVDIFNPDILVLNVEDVRVGVAIS